MNSAVRAAQRSQGPLHPGLGTGAWMELQLAWRAGRHRPCRQQRQQGAGQEGGSSCSGSQGPMPSARRKESHGAAGLCLLQGHPDCG